MALGHGSNNQIKGAPKLKTKDPWRTVPQGAGEGISSDGNTITLAPIDDGQVIANTSGANDIPVGTSLSDLLDHDLTDVQGSIIFRGATEWTFLEPGTTGYVLTTRDVGFNPDWELSGGGSKGALPKGPPIALGDGNLDLALTDGNFPDPQIILNGFEQPIYVAVPLDPSGPNSVTMTAATDLNGNFFIKSNGSGLAAVPDLTILADGIAVVGITTGAIASGASGPIQTGGIMTDPSWSWTPGGAIYVGASGLPTQTVPSSKWVLQGGVAINATTMEITLGCVISTPL